MRLIMAILTAALAGAALLVTASSDATSSVAPGPSLTANKAAAKADAAKLLGEIALPAGAQRLSAEPAGDNGYLKAIPHLVATIAGFVDTGWWEISDATPAQVIAAVQAAPPADVTSRDTGGTWNTKTGTSDTSVTYDLKNVSDVLDARMIEVSATALSGGGTGVMVQSQSVWVVPRTAGSIIPASTRAIRVSVVARTGKSRKRLESKTVIAPSRVRATVRFFNGLPAVQPFAFSCPAEFAGGADLTVDFERTPGGKVLAAAEFSELFGGTSNECNSIGLTVQGKAQNSVLGGNYVASLDRLLGVRLPVKRGGIPG
jgi:hypothetical protein